MDIHRLRPTCSSLTSPHASRGRTTPIIALFILGLFVLSVACRHWYVLYIDLDSCLSCGPLIISIGAYFDFDYAYPSSIPDDYALGLPENPPVDGEAWRTALRDLQPGEVVIDTGLYVYVGLWSVTVCLADARTCVDVSPTSTSALRTVQPVADGIESVFDCRPYLLLALIAHVLAFLCSRLTLTATGSETRLAAGVETAAAVFCLVAVATASMPYMTLGNFRHARPLPPWALIAATTSGNLSFLLAYQLWTGGGPRRESLQTWQARQLYKYPI